MSKQKTNFLAKILADWKGSPAEFTALTVDDVNGISLNFPDIAEMSDLAVGTVVEIEDGTYTIKDGDSEASVTIIVADGVVAEIVNESDDEPLQAVLEEITAQFKTMKADFVALQKDHNDLKKSLKHDTKEPTAGTTNKSKYKIT